MFKVNNRSTRYCSDVIVVIFKYLTGCFFADFENVNAEWNIFLL